MSSEWGSPTGALLESRILRKPEASRGLRVYNLERGPGGFTVVSETIYPQITQITQMARTKRKKEKSVKSAKSVDGSIPRTPNRTSLETLLAVGDSRE